MEQSAHHDSEAGQSQPAQYTPEARRRTVQAGGHLKAFHSHFGPESRSFEVIRRVAVGCFNDGSIHAGNLAYMSLLAIFPFFILAAAILSAVGDGNDRAATIEALVSTLPPTAANVIEPVALSVIDARTGWLLWAGAAVGLWTAASLVETIRDILRRSYGTQPSQPFWKYRIGSIGIIAGAVLLLIFSLVAQVTIAAVQNVILENFPDLGHALEELTLSRAVTALALFGSIWMLFVALTPTEYRTRRYHKWPGALLVTLWWIAVAEAFPPILRTIFAYNLTYGSLAGVMITLFFFWLVGLGIVAGAELNAALAVTPEEERDRREQEEHEASDTADETEGTAR